MAVKTLGWVPSELGMIPEGWSVRPLKDLAEFRKGSGLPKKEIVSSGGSYPCIHYGELFTHYGADIDTVTSRTNRCDYSSRSRTSDVLMPTSDVTPTGLAKASCIKDENVILGSDILVIRCDPKAICGSYLSRTIRWDRHQVLGLVSGSTVFHLYGSSMASFRLRVPPLPEQRAIAEALADGEAYIAALDELLAKKRDIFYAARNLLLSARGGGWRRKRLGELLAVRHGKSQWNVLDLHGSVPILGTGGQVGWASRAMYDRPSVLIGRKGTIDAPQYIDVPFWTIDTLFYTHMQDDTDAEFMYHVFSRIPWITYNEASGVPSLNASTIEAIEVDVPEGGEQRRIAAILHDFQAEIAALEAQKDKASLIKQGMMQELLTGKTRLV